MMHTGAGLGSSVLVLKTNLTIVQIYGSHPLYSVNACLFINALRQTTRFVYINARYIIFKRVDRQLLVSGYTGGGNGLFNDSRLI